MGFAFFMLAAPNACDAVPLSTRKIYNFAFHSPRPTFSALLPFFNLKSKLYFLCKKFCCAVFVVAFATHFNGICVKYTLPINHTQKQTATIDLVAVFV
jgi:hypothetical protein